MGKISEALKRGQIGGKEKEGCGGNPIIVKTQDIIDVEPWDSNKLKLDPKGYFLFEIEDGFIYAGFVNYQNELLKVFRAKEAIAMFKAILKEELVSNEDHAAYVGYELGKCEECLKHNKEYIQS
ncbi:MAG: hypothetical protein CMH63_00420 [Nanoarchaeota archaeon]|jgi:hypothetical protein|nr:hypothetical protein [Nanoarchaeota archaeon]|tara:strand:- start:1418 stop:1789 length:372 start_codon:yes stop_codon:yes gene_type:complete